MRLAGIVLDLYDDPKGLVLRNKIASSGRPLPEKLASLRVLEAEELDRLPDRLFAMVATNGDEVVRKYAMQDEAHLVLSMIYFDEASALLPTEVQAKIAMNLVNGCSWYGIDPPTGIVKKAALGAALVAGLGTMDMASKAREGKAQGKANMEAFRQAQASGAKTAGRQIDLSLAQDQAMQRGEGAEGGYIWGPLSQFSKPGPTHRKLDEQLSKRDQLEPELGKRADLVGTEAMPQATLRSGSGRPSPGRRLNLPQKTSAAKLAAALVPEGWWHCGDLTKAEPPVVEKKASHRHFALPHYGRYPIDTPGLVTKAAAYFEEHLYEFPPEERRVYAQSVLDRAGELGVKVSGALLDYAGEGYGPNLLPELHARIHRFEGTGHEAVYSLLLEKQAEIDPVVMADMLREADEATGAARSYGRSGVGLLDPYAAVYGGAKLAAAQPSKEDAYSWSEGNDYVSGMQLVALSKRALNLDDTFGSGFASSFQKDPIGIFESMPSPQKVVLSRLAADNSGGNTFRI